MIPIVINILLIVCCAIMLPIHLMSMPDPMVKQVNPFYYVGWHILLLVAFINIVVSIVIYVVMGIFYLSGQDLGPFREVFATIDFGWLTGITIGFLVMRKDI